MLSELWPTIKEENWHLPHALMGFEVVPRPPGPPGTLYGYPIEYVEMGVPLNDDEVCAAAGLDQAVVTGECPACFRRLTISEHEHGVCIACGQAF